MFRPGIILALLFAVHVNALDLLVDGCEFPKVTESGDDYTIHQHWEFEVGINGRQQSFWLYECYAKIENVPDANYSIRYRGVGTAGEGPWQSLGDWTVENGRIVGNENPALGAQKRFWFDVNPTDYVEPWTVDASLLDVGSAIPVADVKIEVTRVALSTAAAGNTQDITISGFGTPKAAIFIASGATTDDTIAAGLNFGIGFTDGTRQWVTSWGSEDAVSSSNSSRAHRDDTVIHYPTYSAGAGPRMGFNSWITDGVRLDIDDAFSSAYQVTVILIGGADVANAYVNFHDDLGNSASTTDITAPGFEPDLVFLSTIAAGGAPPDDPRHAFVIFGAAHNGASVTQVGASIGFDDNVNPSDTAGIVSDTLALNKVDDATNKWTGSIGSFDASGFSITTDANSGASIVGYLALKFNNNPDIALFDMSWPTSGNYAETQPGFTPDFGMLVSVDSATTLDTVGSTGGVGMSIAAFDDGGIYTVNATDQTNVSPTVSKSLSSDQLRILDGGGATNEVVASSYAFDADGWDFTLSTNPGTAFLGWGLAIGAGASGTTHDVSASEGLTINSVDSVAWAVEAESAEALGLASVDTVLQVAEVARVEPAVVASNEAAEQVAEVDCVESAGVNSDESCLVSSDLSAAETVSVTDANSVTAIFAADITVALAVASNEDVAAVFESTLVESAGFNSVEDVAHTAAVSTGESISIASVETGTVGASTIDVDVAETIAAASAETVQQVAVVDGVESISVGSVDSAVQVVAASVAESLAVTETNSASRIIAAAIVESLTANDSSTILVTIDGVVSESIGLSGIESTQVSHSVDSVFGLAIAEAVLAQSIVEAGLTESVTITEVNTDAGVVFDITTPSGRTCRVIGQGRTVVVENGSRTVKL